VIGDFVIDREENNLEILKLLLSSQQNKGSGITHDVYTFI